MTACPLCGSTHGSTRLKIGFAEIWRRLEADWGARISAPVRARHMPAPETHLIECDECGLQYFRPAVPGDEEFYAELMRGAAYVPDRWEFDIAAMRVRPGEAVVDLGCGDGAFLRRLAGHRGRVVGVDHNAEATARIHAEGVDVFDGDPAGFAEAQPGEFDVACAFQLLEHLPAAAELIGPMRRLVEPRGRILISVPNRDRAIKDETAPFDCPPHHISRWSEAQLTALAGEFGLELRELAREPVDYSGAVAQTIAPLETVLSRIPRPLRRPTRGALRRVVLTPRRYERAMARDDFARRGIHGHTMLAELSLR